MLLLAHLGPDTITEIHLQEEEEQKEEEDLQGADQECLLTKCQTTITGTTGSSSPARYHAISCSCAQTLLIYESCPRAR